MKKRLAGSAAVILALGIISASGQVRAGAEYVLKIADTQPETSAVVRHIRMFGDLISRRTGDRLSAQIFPAAIMGPSPAVMQQVQMGAIDVFRCDASVLFDFGVESMKVLSLPYLFKSKEYAQEVLYGPVGRKFLQDVDDAGIGYKTIGWIIEPSRNLFLRNKRVAVLADMKGLKIRVPESDIFLATMEAFGAAPTPIPMGEVYTSLQTGVVDGAENTIDTFNVNRFDEICKYIAMDQHNFNICPIVFSKLNWDKLSPADQQAVLDCWDEASRAYDDYAVKNDAEAREIARSRGVEFVEPADKDAWVNAVKPLYQKFGAGYEDVIARIQAN